MPWLCCFTFSLTHLHQHQHQHPYRIVTVAFAVPQHCPYQMLHTTNSSRRISKCMQIFKERDKESRRERAEVGTAWSENVKTKNVHFYYIFARFCELG